jgi:hypothetical protein
MSDEAEVRSGDAEVAVKVERGEIAIVPGTTEKGRKVSVSALDVMEDGGKLLGEHEETALGGRVLIAESLEESVGGEASGLDTASEPERVDAFEQVRDEVPARAFASFAGIADEDDEEVESVAGGLNHAVRAGADEITEGRQELQQNGGRVSLGVGSEEANDAAG